MQWTCSLAAFEKVASKMGTRSETTRCQFPGVGNCMQSGCNNTAKVTNMLPFVANLLSPTYSYNDVVAAGWWFNCKRTQVPSNLVFIMECNQNMYSFALQQQQKKHHSWGAIITAHKYLQTFTSLSESDCSQMTTAWRQVAAHQLTCAVTLWSKVVVQWLMVGCML